jgi:hypothetical protein
MRKPWDMTGPVEDDVFTWSPAETAPAPAADPFPQHLPDSLVAAAPELGAVSFTALPEAAAMLAGLALGALADAGGADGAGDGAGGLADAKASAVSGGSTGGGTLAVTGSLLTSYKSGSAAVADSAEYNVEIVFKGTLWTVALQQAFIDAANQISSFIVGDVQNVSVVGGGQKRTVDDISITAELKTIDGVGAVLGQAGPTALRTGSYLPATATMQFDAADAQWLYDAGQWGYVILHEMLHCEGIGTIWDRKGLIDTSVAGTAFYKGANGNAWLNQIQGTTGQRIAIETDGGSGTAYGHWDEATYGNELMTGWLNSGVNYLSNMSIGSLKDLGYSIASQYILA